MQDRLLLQPMPLTVFDPSVLGAILRNRNPTLLRKGQKKTGSDDPVSGGFGDHLPRSARYRANTSENSPVLKWVSRSAGKSERSADGFQFGQHKIAQNNPFLVLAAYESKEAEILLVCFPLSHKPGPV